MLRTRALSLIVFCLTAPSFAATAPPGEFGSDWDDPRTAAPSVERPATKPCVVEIVDHGFTSFDPYQRKFTPPVQCPGPWSKVVLDMDGEVKGRQYDRISHIEIGGVTVLRTSTPEPSRDGISWHVEKDVSAYAPLLSQPQEVSMWLGNVVNDTYTGVFQIKARLSFYPTDAAHPALAAADRIEPPQQLQHDGPDITGQFTLPANARRLMAEVYATGSGGGCEEFWYFTTPKDAKYSCPTEQGPYREVQVLLDGRVAGIAMPYPHIYTGGWSNPFLWYVLPAPRTFDIRPIQVDLTPFVGELTDGKAHEVRVRVLGVARDSEGWKLLPALHIWLDAAGTRTRGKLAEYQLDDLDLTTPVSHQSNGDTVVDTRGRHRLKVRGELHTSTGVVATTIEYRVANTNVHRWDGEENHDRLDIAWTEDVDTVVRVARRAPTTSTVQRRYAIQGGIRTAPVAVAPPKCEGAACKDTPQRLTTEILVEDAITQEFTQEQAHSSAKPASTQTADRFEGSASYTSGVPREQRNAVGTSTQHYTRGDSAGGCYDRTLTQQNGRVVEDRNACP